MRAKRREIPADPMNWIKTTEMKSGLRIHNVPSTDGEVVLVWAEGTYNTAYWDKDEWRENGSGYVLKPSHWMPIRPPTLTTPLRTRFELKKFKKRCDSKCNACTHCDNNKKCCECVYERHGCVTWERK